MAKAESPYEPFKMMDLIDKDCLDTCYGLQIFRRVEDSGQKFGEQTFSSYFHQAISLARWGWVLLIVFIEDFLEWLSIVLQATAGALYIGVA